MSTNFIKFCLTCRLSLHCISFTFLHQFLLYDVFLGSSVTMWALEGSNTWMPPATQMSNTCKSNAQQGSLLGQFLHHSSIFEHIRCVGRFWMTCMQLFLSEYVAVLAQSPRNRYSKSIEIQMAAWQTHIALIEFKCIVQLETLQESCPSFDRDALNNLNTWIWMHWANLRSMILCCQMSRLCNALRAVEKRGKLTAASNLSGCLSQLRKTSRERELNKESALWSQEDRGDDSNLAVAKTLSTQWQSCTVVFVMLARFNRA